MSSSIPSKTNFIEYLDNYKNTNGVDYYALANILHLINVNYMENQYYDSNFSGGSPKSFYPIPHHISHIFSNSNKSLLRTSSKDDYELWKKKHEAIFANIPDDFITIRGDLKIGNISLNDSILKTKTQEIDVSLNNLGDVLKMMKENPYQSDTEYNIDLKSLSNIKTELETLSVPYYPCWTLYPEMEDRQDFHTTHLKNIQIQFSIVTRHVAINFRYIICRKIYNNSFKPLLWIV